MKHKTRKRLSLFILLVGIPVYIGLVVGIMGLVYDRFGQLPIWLELLIYVILGVACFFPLKPIFLGTSREDPDAVAEAAGPETEAGSDPGATR